MSTGSEIEVVAETDNGWYKSADGYYVKASFTQEDEPYIPEPVYYDDDDDDEDYYESDDDEFYEDDDDDVVFEVNCPFCEETICLPSSIDLAHVICPACGEEFSCICDEDDDCECCCGECEESEEE